MFQCLFFVGALFTTRHFVRREGAIRFNGPAARRHAEDALKESKRQRRMAMAAGAVGVWDWNLKTGQVTTDVILKELLGCTNSEIPDTVDAWRRRIHPDELTNAATVIKDCVKGRTDRVETEVRLRHKDGSLRLFLVRGRIIRDYHSVPQRVVGTSTDITERRGEATARKSEKRLEPLVESPLLIWKAGADGLVTYVNHGWLTFTGRSLGEEMGNGWLDTVHPDDCAHFSDSYHAAFNERRPFTIELRLRRSDAEYRWVLNHGAPCFLPDGTFLGYVGSCLDITKRKEDESEIHQSREELFHLSRVSLLGALSSALAHELNQPLGAILSNAQAGLRYLNHESPNLAEVRDILQDIAAEDQRAGDVIRHMRLLLKRRQTEFVPIELNKVVHDVLSLIRSEMMHRGTTVELLIDEHLPHVACDCVQLQQVLINLMLNGSEAMQHLPPVHRRLKVRTYQRENLEVVVDVSDAGHGIKPDDMPRLFSPFFTTKKKGLGVGLAICKSIIDGHGGRLEAENNPDRGATFHVTLPVAAGRANGESARLHPPSISINGAVHDSTSTTAYALSP